MTAVWNMWHPVCVCLSLSRWCPEWPRPTTESSCGWPMRASSPSCRPVAAATWWGRACGSAWTTSSPTSRLSPTYRWGVMPTRRRKQALAGRRSLDCVSSVSAGSLEGLQAEEEVQRQAEVSDGPQRRCGQGEVPQSPPTPRVLQRPRVTSGDLLPSVPLRSSPRSACIRLARSTGIDSSTSKTMWVYSKNK